MSFFGRKRFEIEVSKTMAERRLAEYKIFLSEREKLFAQIDRLTGIFVQKAKAHYGDDHTYLFKELQHISTVILTATDSDKKIQGVVYPVILWCDKQRGIDADDIFKHEDGLHGIRPGKEDEARYFFKGKLFAIDKNGYLFAVDSSDQTIAMISVKPIKGKPLELVAGITDTQYAGRHLNQLKASKKCVVSGHNLGVEFIECKYTVELDHVIASDAKRNEFAQSYLKQLKGLMIAMKQTLKLGEK